MTQLYGGVNDNAYGPPGGIGSQFGPNGDLGGGWTPAAPDNQFAYSPNGQIGQLEGYNINDTPFYQETPHGMTNALTGGNTFFARPQQPPFQLRANYPGPGPGGYPPPGGPPGYPPPGGPPGYPPPGYPPQQTTVQIQQPPQQQQMQPPGQPPPYNPMAPPPIPALPGYGPGVQFAPISGPIVPERMPLVQTPVTAANTAPMGGSAMNPMMAGGGGIAPLRGAVAMTEAALPPPQIAPLQRQIPQEGEYPNAPQRVAQAISEPQGGFGGGPPQRMTGGPSGEAQPDIDPSGQADIYAYQDAGGDARLAEIQKQLADTPEAQAERYATSVAGGRPHGFGQFLHQLNAINRTGAIDEGSFQSPGEYHAQQKENWLNSKSGARAATMYDKLVDEQKSLMGAKIRAHGALQRARITAETKRQEEQGKAFRADQRLKQGEENLEIKRAQLNAAIDWRKAAQSSRDREEDIRQQVADSRGELQKAQATAEAQKVKFMKAQEHHLGVEDQLKLADGIMKQNKIVGDWKIKLQQLQLNQKDVATRRMNAEAHAAAAAAALNDKGGGTPEAQGAIQSLEQEATNPPAQQAQAPPAAPQQMQPAQGFQPPPSPQMMPQNQRQFAPQATPHATPMQRLWQTANQYVKHQPRGIIDSEIRRASKGKYTLQQLEEAYGAVQ